MGAKPVPAPSGRYSGGVSKHETRSHLRPDGERMGESGGGRDVSDVMSPSDIIIAVMGMTGAGKTTFISRCMGEDVGIGHGLHSYTQDVAIHSFRHRGHIIRLIDTPGFDDTIKSDANVLNNIAFWLSHAYRASPKLLLDAIIYLHPIHETRMTGSATKNLEMMKLVCGAQALPAVVLATTMWDHLPLEAGVRREQELVSTEQFWGSFIRNGSACCRHQNTGSSAFAIIDRIIDRQRKVSLAVQRQMVDERRLVDETDAGRYLCRTLLREQEKVQGRLARSAEELDRELDAQDAERVQELLQRQQEYQQKLEEKGKSLQAMRLDMEKLREEKAREFEAREQQFTRDKQEQISRMQSLDQQLRDLQQERDAAVKRAEEAATTARTQGEDDSLRQLLLKDQAAIAEIDRAMSARYEEERSLEKAQQQTVKKESVFKHTLKVTAAETVIHWGMHIGKEILTAACTLM